MCKVCGMRRTTGRDVRLRGSELKIENRAKELFQKKSDFWNTVAGDVRACYRPMLCTHMSSEKRGRLRVSSPQFWMLQLSIGEAVGLTDCAHADVAVDEVASGSQGLAIDFEQIEFLDLGLEYAHRRVRQ